MPNVFDISKLTETTKVQETLSGHVLPPVPALTLLPFSSDVPINKANGYKDENTNIKDKAQRYSVEVFEEDWSESMQSIAGTPMYFPLRIKKASEPDSSYWLLPLEPMITISGGNTLVRRNVAKGSLRGTIKERWNTEDYSIKIDGMLKTQDEWKYPYEAVNKLRELMEAKEPLDVLCPLLEKYHISRIAVEKYDFPFTKGMENQSYSITAYSDDNWSLLVEKEDVQLG
jgi:hypothetical protein